MSLRIRLLLTVIMIIGIFCMDIIANKLYLYWTYTWLDKGMHLLGGIAAGFLGLIIVQYVWNRRKKALPVMASASSLLRVGTAIVSAMVLGGIWEVVEFLLHISRFGPNFAFDTVTDLIMDFIGGLIAYFIWTKLPQKNK